MDTRLVQLNSSMGYILRADDGSTVIIDGGKECQSAVLMEALHELFGNERPVVDLWILTHLHNDHTFACKTIAEQYAEEITVKKLWYRFPDPSLMHVLEAEVPKECEALERALERLGCPAEQPNSGDVCRLGNLEIEVLFTCAELPSLSEDPRQNLNDASLVFRVNVGGQKLLFTGDVSESGCRWLCARYGHTLKSDVCQVSHHGWFGATTEFYNFVDPKILLWPSDVKMYQEATSIVWPSRYLLDELHVKDVYLAGEGTLTLHLPLALRQPPRIPPVPSRYRSLKPRFFSPRAPQNFHWADPDHCAWQLDTPKKGVSFRKNEEEGDCEISVLWSEEALFCKVNFRKPLYPSSCDQTGTGNTNNVRFYLSEIAVDDKFCRWENCPQEGFERNLKFFPEEKAFPFGHSRCNVAEFSSYQFHIRDDSYILCLCLPWAKPHRKGDRIGFTVEVSAANREGTGRVCRYLLTAGKQDDYCAQTPSALPVFELV